MEDKERGFAMNTYFKYMIVSVVTALCCYMPGEIYEESMMLSQVVMDAAFGTIDIGSEYIAFISQWFLPMLVFHIIFGTYIYKKFCSASVYYFSRTENRTKWYLKETLMLYGMVICYLITFVGTGMIVAMVKKGIKYDSESIWIFLYYLIIYSLFLFSTTLAINLIAIKISSVIGFGVIEGCLLTGITLFVLLGDYVEKQVLLVTEAIPSIETLQEIESSILSQYSWLLKINPFAHLVFPIHSSQYDVVDLAINQKGILFDLNESVMYYAVLSAVVLTIGHYLIKNCEFLTNEKE